MISERLYRALLLIYPSGHRQEYGEPMVQMFRDRMRRDGGGIRTLIVWIQMVFDLVCSASTEHKEGVMLEGLQAHAKIAVVRSGKFLLWSLVGAIALYMATTAVVLTAGLVSLIAGWYQFTIESGPLGFLGYTMLIDNRTNFEVGVEFSLLGFLVLVGVAGLLNGVWSAMRGLPAYLRT